MTETVQETLSAGQIYERHEREFCILLSCIDYGQMWKCASFSKLLTDGSLRPPVVSHFLDSQIRAMRFIGAIDK